MTALQLMLFGVAMLFAKAGFAARIAAAADLKFTMEQIVAAFRQANPADEVEVIYGPSGKFHAQIRNGAPYDLFFSADVIYPRELAQAGLAASEVIPYARDRIVLWSATLQADKLTLATLADPGITRVAIARSLAVSPRPLLMDEPLAHLDLPIPLGEDAGVVLDAGHAVVRQVRMRIQARDVSLALTPHPASSIFNLLPAVVEAIKLEADPALALVGLRLGVAPMLARLTRRSADALGLAPGKPVYVQTKAVALVG